jgi:hypothetical protein
MSALISAYLVVAFLFVFLPMIVRGSVKTFLRLLFFPVIPFFIAWKIRKEKPLQSKLLFWLYGTFYVLIIFIFLVNE